MGKKVTYDALYLRNYRRYNPDKAEQWRTTSEINHLTRLGYTVTPPQIINCQTVQPTASCHGNGGDCE